MELVADVFIAGLVASAVAFIILAAVVANRGSKK